MQLLKIYYVLSKSSEYIEKEYSIVTEQWIVFAFVYFEQSRTFPQEMTFESISKQEFFNEKF